MRTLCTILGVLAMMGAVPQVYWDGNEIAYYISTDEEDRDTVLLSLISGSVLKRFPVQTRNMEKEWDYVRHFFKINFPVQTQKNMEIKWDYGWDYVRHFFKINFFFAFIDIILNLGMIGASVCLLYGVYNKEGKFLLPLIWFLPSELIVRCFFVFVLFTYFGITSPVSLRIDALFSFVIMYDTIFWLCVKSHKEQLISNNDNNQHVPG